MRDSTPEIDNALSRLRDQLGTGEAQNAMIQFISSLKYRPFTPPLSSSSSTHLKKQSKFQHYHTSQVYSNMYFPTILTLLLSAGHVSAVDITLVGNSKREQRCGKLTNPWGACTNAGIAKCCKDDD